MQARLFLGLIFFAILFVLLTNGKVNLLNPFEVILFQKSVEINSEMIVALIMLSTLVGVFFIGVLNRLLFYKGNKKSKNKEL